MTARSLDDLSIGKAHRDVLARARGRNCSLLLRLLRFATAAAANPVSISKAETFDLDSFLLALHLLLAITRVLIHQY